METIDPIRFARHELRGCLHAMKLCVAALDTELSPEETDEFIGHVEQAAERLPGLLDALEKVMPPTDSAG